MANCSATCSAVQPVDDFELVPSLVPHGSLLEVELDEFDTFLLGCECSETSTCDDLTRHCSCCLRLPLAYESDHRLKRKYLDAASLQPPIVECGSLCGCADACRNRVVGAVSTIDQIGKVSSLEVFTTPKKGRGLRTLKSIPALTFVCEYAGEVISLEEAARRSREFTEDTYIFVMQEQNTLGSAPIRTCVDGRRKGSLARFINHSCRPNLFMVPVRVDITIPRLAFFAAEDIDTGQELTVDYGQQDDSASVDARQRLSDRLSSTECACGISNCRKFLPFQSDVFLLDKIVNPSSLALT